MLVILIGRGWWCLAITTWADARKKGQLFKEEPGEVRALSFLGCLQTLWEGGSKTWEERCFLVPVATTHGTCICTDLPGRGDKAGEGRSELVVMEMRTAGIQ